MRSLARMMRRNCSGCAGPSIRWGSVADLRARLSDREALRQLAEGEAMCGPVSEAWWCLDCGEYGLFGPAEFSA